MKLVRAFVGKEDWSPCAEEREKMGAKFGGVTNESRNNLPPPPFPLFPFCPTYIHVYMYSNRVSSSHILPFPTNTRLLAKLNSHIPLR